ncbi:MAG TPA: hypothetical protein VH724_01490 [Candidatus Angelobacter sp.]|nr:hypothetical protein [Candidatus Angelobacter sp.]
MFVGKARFAMTFVAVFAGVCAGQRVQGNGQSPRQAMIEMLSGGEAPFKKHLTVEMQAKLQNLMKASMDNAPNPFLAMLGAPSSGSNKFQSFDMGQILFSFNNPQEHERYELHIDSDQPAGDEDNMALSLHLVRNGMEREIPVGLRFVLNLKRQEGTWRLNAVTFSATVPVGDPRVLEKSWWGPVLAAATGSADPTAATEPVVVDERPKMNPLRAVRMIGMAENIYAQQHPGLGYTCTLGDLVNVGKGMDEEGMYKFMDADFADGLYNGYKFTLSGCERTPARLFRITAEPVAGKGKAYCSDSANNLRASDDGRGTTCLISGKIARK